MSININGTDYETVSDGYDLEVVFSKKMVDGGMCTQEIYESNVVAYHSQEAFQNFVNDAFDNGGERNPQLLLVALGGPGAIGDLIKNARSFGIKGTRAGTARKQRAWQTNLIEALVGIGHGAMSDYYNENKEELFTKCSVPTDAQSDDYSQMLINTTRGTLGYRVDQWEGTSPKTGAEGKFAITLTYRLDANNKGRAVRKDTTNGVSSSAPAEAHAK